MSVEPEVLPTITAYLDKKGGMHRTEEAARKVDLLDWWKRELDKILPLAADSHLDWYRYLSGQVICNPEKLIPLFKELDKRLHGDSWWVRRKPTTVYQTEKIARRYGTEVAEVFIRANSN